jgi:hypothetical protein
VSRVRRTLVLPDLGDPLFPLEIDPLERVLSKHLWRNVVKRNQL